MTDPDKDQSSPATRSDTDLLAECRIETFRSGGAGGQHQNVTESGVRLTHRATGITAIARDERSQLRNRRIALARLRKKLEAHYEKPTLRIETQVPRRERAQRLQEKKLRSHVKALRRPPRRSGSDEGSDE